MSKLLVNICVVCRKQFISSLGENRIFPTGYSKNNNCKKMRDNIVRLNNEDLAPSIEKAVRCIENGEIIAIPTDTIYGLACLAQNTKSIEKLYKIKSRQLSKPISISLGNVTDIFKWAHVTVSEHLLNDLLPGPVTVVFERTTNLNPCLNPQSRLVGVRVPEDKFIVELCAKCSGPIALTSANFSSHDSALNIQEFSELWPSIDLIFDGGPITVNNNDKSGSTVVDLSKPGHYYIIRSGCAEEITISALERHKLEPIISPFFVLKPFRLF